MMLGLLHEDKFWSMTVRKLRGRFLLKIGNLAEMSLNLNIPVSVEIVNQVVQTWCWEAEGPDPEAAAAG